MQTVVAELAQLADLAYKEFQAGLVPTVDPERILGVRTPALRRYARAFARDPRLDAFLAEPLPHGTYEEMNLHAELIGILGRTPSRAFEMLEPFLPCIDNWATCDLIKIRAFNRDLPAVYQRIARWVRATGPRTEYVVRFGVVQLMEHFLEGAFLPEHLELVCSIDRPEYYINMARAWYLSFAIIKQPAATMPLFEWRGPAGETRLDRWTHNKALQKARESRRVAPGQKAYLQTLKV